MKLNQTINKSLQIIELLAKKPMTFTEIVNQSNIPKSSVYDILTTLKYNNIIEQSDHNQKKYSIGYKLYVLGNSYIDNNDIMSISRPIISNLSKTLGKTIVLGTRNNDKVLYLQKQESNSSLVITSRIGSLNPIYCTALGKVILAYSNDYEEYLSKIDLIPKTKNTITDRDKLIENLRITKKRAYSIDNGEFEKHIYCVASPIFSYDSSVNYALSVVNMYSEDIDLAGIVCHLQEATRNISLKLGYIE